MLNFSKNCLVFSHIRHSFPYGFDECFFLDIIEYDGFIMYITHQLDTFQRTICLDRWQMITVKLDLFCYWRRSCPTFMTSLLFELHFDVSWLLEKSDLFNVITSLQCLNQILCDFLETTMYSVLLFHSFTIWQLIFYCSTHEEQ